MANFRFLFSPGSPGPNSVNPGSYRTAPGQPAIQIAGSAGAIVDTPDNGLAAQDLASQRWISLAPSGTTAQRPPPATMTGKFFIDTTVAKVITSDGTTFRDPMTGNSV